MEEDVLEDLKALYGHTFRSDWLRVDQGMIDRFADTTMDTQYIHVDPERANGSLFGGTIAHGFLTLSLLSHFATALPHARHPKVKTSLNYGFDRVRFVAPLRSGTRVRGAFTLHETHEKRPGQLQNLWDVVVEREGQEQPALIASWLTLMFI